ncbi:MAG: N-acetylglucosamine-6-phosphate deacetylase [Anaerolineae bacterium]|nr:N-acetylglucosamine-6-phosphate deacetylase [Anaerolineae bacterium]
MAAQAIPKADGPAIALVNGRVVLPDRIVTGTAVVVEGRRIAGLVAPGELPEGVVRLDVGGRYIAPGLVDIHTHGAVGHSFNEPSPEAFRAITEENARHGTTSLLATIAAAPLPDMLACLEACRAWCSVPRPGAEVLGVHLEGPYFSPAQRGAQDLASLRTPDDGSADELLAYSDVIRMISYAPELPGALELTRQLAGLGIVPAAGHSAARDTEVYAAMEAGLRHAIHLWSGQSTTIRQGPWRRPGLLEAALVSDGLTAEIIADGRHLPPTLMKLAYRCKGPDRLCLVSDAIAGAGLPDGSRFRLATSEYAVRDGVGMLPDGTAFAGSVTFLSRMVALLVEMVGVPLVQAVRMASLTPARIIGVADRKGSLEPGKDADLLVLEADLTPWRVMVRGEWVEARASASSPAG